MGLLVRCHIAVDERYRLIVEWPMVTGTRAHGTKSPLESATLGIASVMIVDNGADLGPSVMAVRSIFELQRRDAQYDNQLN